MSVYADELWNRSWGISCLVIVVMFGIVWTGCDTTVPIFENPEDRPLYFSLYGQVAYPEGGTIRVEPLRDSIAIGAREEVPETVTFTTVASGKVDTLKLDTSRVGPLPVHNYRTPSPLSAGAMYRIEASSLEGNTTSATLTLPARRPDVRVLDTLRYCDPGEQRGHRALPVRVRVDAVERLARLTIQYETQSGLSNAYRWTNTSQHIDEDAHRVEIVTDWDLIDAAGHQIDGFPPPDGLPPPAIAESATVTVVAAGPGWPGSEFNLAQLEEIAIPNQYSNVQQGVGLVVGTYSVEADVPVEVPDLTDLPSCP